MSRVLIWLLCAAAIALACVPRAQTRPARADSVAAAPGEADLSLRDTLASSLDVNVSGGEVRLVFHVTNRTDRKVEITFPSGQRYDFAVLDAGGRELWRWGADRMFTQAIQTRLLDPNETMTADERWNAGGRTGRFTAVATLRSSNYPLEQRVEFTLP
jgi:hypothetical protein